MAVADTVDGFGEEHRTGFEGEVEVLEFDHAVADSGGDFDAVIPVDKIDGAEEAALHRVFDLKTGIGVCVANCFVEHEGERSLVHAPSVAVVDVEETDGFGFENTVLHSFHLVIDQSAKDGVLEGKTAKIGIVFLGEGRKRGALLYLTAFACVFDDDFDGVHNIK